MSSSDLSLSVSVSGSPSASAPLSVSVSPSAPSPAQRERQRDRERPQRLCVHFAQGQCRYGEQCRFSHAPPSPSPSVSPALSPSLAVSRSPHTPQRRTAPLYFHTHTTHTHMLPMHTHHTHHTHMLPPPHTHGFPHTHMPVTQPPPLLLNVDYTPHTAHTQGPPPPIGVHIAPHLSVFSIDVECVATGVQHDRRAVAQVALCDAWGRPVFNAYIKQDQPVASYLTELTGITQDLLEQHGVPLADALASLRSHLSPRAVLVAHSIERDIQWLQLIEGIDYHALIDLSLLYRVYNMNHGAFTFFSQDHIASVCLFPSSTESERDRESAVSSSSSLSIASSSALPPPRQHNALEDAQLAMSLFNLYALSLQHDIARLHDTQRRLLRAPRVKSFSALHAAVDGCCMGNRKTCFCGAPFV